MAMFMKNVSILGAALLISKLGAGQFSLDARAYSRRQTAAFKSRFQRRKQQLQH